MSGWSLMYWVHLQWSLYSDIAGSHAFCLFLFLNLWELKFRTLIFLNLLEYENTYNLVPREKFICVHFVRLKWGFRLPDWDVPSLKQRPVRVGTLNLMSRSIIVPRPLHVKNPNYNWISGPDAHFPQDLLLIGKLNLLGCLNLGRKNTVWRWRTSVHHRNLVGVVNTCTLCHKRRQRPCHNMW